jgi:hypothetical protein
LLDKKLKLWVLRWGILVDEYILNFVKYNNCLKHIRQSKELIQNTIRSITLIIKIFLAQTPNISLHNQKNVITNQTSSLNQTHKSKNLT